MEEIYYYYIIGALVILLLFLFIKMFRNKKPSLKSIDELEKKYNVDKARLDKESEDMNKQYNNAKDYLDVPPDKSFRVKEASIKTVVERKLTRKQIKKVETDIKKEDSVIGKLTPIDENIHIKKQGMLSLQRYKQWWYKNTKAHKSMIVNIELLNGNMRSFITIEDAEKIKYGDKIYIVDTDAKTYNMDLKMWQISYHEQYTLPVKIRIPANKIRNQLRDDPNVEVEYASNPSTLERFVISRIAEGIMKGQALDEFMRQIRLISIIGCLATIILLLMFMVKTGMFSQIKDALPI